MLISFETDGNSGKTEAFLEKLGRGDVFKALDSFGRLGVSALSANTPVESGATAASWSYEVSKTRGAYTITWTNGHMVDGTPLAILLQYGHGTGTGGYVRGRDYINPAIQPIFDKIANEVWKAVQSA